MKYSFSSRIRFSETDINKRLTIGSLIDYFQDCSTFQAEDLGIGFERLEKENAAWLLMFWQIEINRLPMLGEEVETTTWAYDFKDFYGLRNFTMTEAEGQIAACANSVWVLFDVKKGRPVRIPDDLLERYETEPKLDMDYAPRKIRIPGTITPQQGEEIHVTKQHLDTNHHVNNGRYISFALQYLPDDFELSGLLVEYRNQAKEGDRILPLIYRSEAAGKDDRESVMVSLADQEGRPYAVVQFKGTCRCFKEP